MQASDAAAAASAASRRKDAAKALAVRNQCRLWDKALAVRIALQKALGSADRLPGGDARAHVLDAVSDSEAAYDEATDNCRGAVCELVDVMHVLIARATLSTDELAQPRGGDDANLGGRHANAAQKHKRGRSDGTSVDALWQDIEDAHAQFAPIRDDSVDRWHRKTMLATGRAALKGQMSALNQSLSQQVAAQMRDPTRALERAQRDAQSMPAVLCERAPSAAELAQRGGSAASAAATSVADTEMLGGSTSVPGTYDDTAFYQVLLQEYLESAGVEGATAAALRVRLCNCCHVCRHATLDAHDSKLATELLPLCMRPEACAVRAGIVLGSHNLCADFCVVHFCVRCLRVCNQVCR